MLAGKRTSSAMDGKFVGRVSDSVTRHLQASMCRVTLSLTRPTRLVVQRLLALASAQAVAEQRELSFYKASQWLMRGGRLLKAFLDRQFGSLLRRMLSSLKRLLKQKRKRLTTWQLIGQQVAYLDSFVDMGHVVREELVQAGCALLDAYRLQTPSLFGRRAFAPSLLTAGLYLSFATQLRDGFFCFFKFFLSVNFF